MAWLEITIDTTPEKVNSAVPVLTAKGFPDLVIEDQEEFETFLEENRAYWDYIDEGLQEKLQGLSHIKVYLEDTDASGMERLKKAVEELQLPMNVAALEETNWEESWKDNYPPQEVGERIVVLPYWLSDMETDLRHRCPSLHPDGDGADGEDGKARVPLPGPGQRQRHSVHCRPASGRRERRGHRHRSQGGRHCPGERGLQ